MKYFEVTVEFVVGTTKGGKDKKNKEVYLVDAMTVTEAEAKVIEHFKGIQLDFKVASAKSSRIHEILN